MSKVLTSLPVAQRVGIAFSGGLDTSVAVPWLRETRGCDVVTLTVDVGAGAASEDVLGRAQVEVDLEPKVGYSEKEVEQFVAELAGRIDRDPVNASLEPSGDELSPATGLHSILLDDLARDAEEAITGLLRERGYCLYDARTLKPYRPGDYSLLARA